MGARVDNPLIPPLTIDKKNNLKSKIMEVKDTRLNSLIREYNELAPQGRKLSETTTFVGGSVPIGATRKIASFSCEVYTSQEGVKHPWLAVRFEDGTAVSLRSLMGVPSLEGYTLHGELPCDEYSGNTLPNGERETVIRYAQATAGDWEVSRRFTPSTWCVNDFLNKEAESLKGATVTYRGTAVKPYIVRRPYGGQVPGGRAAISVDLWEVQKPEAPAK